MICLIYQEFRFFNLHSPTIAYISLHKNQIAGKLALKALDSLKLQHEIGAEEAYENSPTSKFNKNLNEKPAIKEVKEAIKPAPVIVKELVIEEDMPAKAEVKIKSPIVAPTPPSAAMKEARILADKAKNLDQLQELVRDFEGCALKKTANKMVFSDGNPKAKVMLVGEAPGANEDVEGIPFCGQSGKLMDEVFAAVGFDRTKLYICNTVFWRPPGNRKPTPEELDICRPFVEKHIALVSPEILILVGGTAVESLLAIKGAVSSLRGKFYPYSNIYLEKPIKAMVTFHPSYLLRQPSQKKQAWQDALFLKSNIK